MMIPVRKIDEATGEAPEQPNAVLNTTEVSSVEVSPDAPADNPAMTVTMQNADRFQVAGTPADLLPKPQ